MTVTPEYWDSAINVNLRHQFFAAQAVHPHMRELGDGSIVNFSSTAWMFGGGDFIVYSTAKAGVVGLTNALARAFGGDNIRVNAIAPGAVMTERQLRLWYTEESADAMAARQMIKQRLLPEEVARAALFLAADDSRMITKQCLLVDAGISLMLDDRTESLRPHLRARPAGPRHAARQPGRPRSRRLHRDRRGARRQDAGDLRAVARRDGRRRTDALRDRLACARHDAGGQRRPDDGAGRPRHPRRDGARREGDPPRPHHRALRRPRRARRRSGRRWSARCATRFAKRRRSRRDAGVTLAIENHQDFGSAELVAFCEEAGPSVGICYDTGNSFPVAEAPLDFTRVVAPHVAPRPSQGLPRPVHRRGLSPRPLRNRRRRGADSPRSRRSSREHHHAPHRRARARRARGAPRAPVHARLVEGLSAEDGARRSPHASPPRADRRLPDDADYRTPWERGEDGALAAYEMDMIRKSAANMRDLGLMEERRMSGELTGKVAFVTGSGRGLGRVMAERLAELGADVAIHDIDWTAPAKYGEFARCRRRRPRRSRRLRRPHRRGHRQYRRPRRRSAKMKAEIDGQARPGRDSGQLRRRRHRRLRRQAEPQQCAPHLLRGHPGR